MTEALATAWNVAGVAAVFALAGAVKGLTGMGLPTVAVSLLGLWMAPLQAAALLVAPSLATNLAQCRGPHLRRLARMLWPAWLGLAAATVLAPPWTAAVDARVLLGVVLVLYGSWGLARPRLPDLRGSAGLAGFVAGSATGLVASATAVFALPLVPFLQSLRLDKDEMVQALGLGFTVATLSLALRIGAVAPGQLVGPGPALAVVAAFLGMWLGTRLRGRISAQAFQRSLLLTFILLGVANLAKGLA
ncbi:sulfite exporter TauE/SafE family protein [Ramlibacter sp. AN1015]|uniref:sulfite exporter TauE/SafE family protein n=1 Tax=Ramlibacter sp. AN1015 TaxID=3133428 RepID=UPI0030C15B03